MKVDIGVFRFARERPVMLLMKCPVVVWGERLLRIS
jgi:hypothetical protein